MGRDSQTWFLLLAELPVEDKMRVLLLWQLPVGCACFADRAVPPQPWPLGCRQGPCRDRAGPQGRRVFGHADPLMLGSPCPVDDKDAGFAGGFPGVRRLQVRADRWGHHRRPAPGGHRQVQWYSPSCLSEGWAWGEWQYVASSRLPASAQSLCHTPRFGFLGTVGAAHIVPLSP